MGGGWIIRTSDPNIVIYRPSTFAIRKKWGSEVVQLLERMWQHDPADRPTMTDVKDDLQAILAEHKKNPQV